MNEFEIYRELTENTLYATDAEKQELIEDKERLASVFLFNFWAMLGLINATTDTQKNMLLKHFKTDKKLRIASIGDENQDLSLSLKLAVDADFFINQTTPNEITRFLVKLKTGQIESIDNAIVYGWAQKIRPTFPVLLKQPIMKAAWKEFLDGKGDVDISHIAVKLKPLSIRLAGDAGDFYKFAKKFGKITERILSPAATPTDGSGQQSAPKRSYDDIVKSIVQNIVASRGDASKNAASVTTTPTIKPQRTPKKIATPKPTSTLSTPTPVPSSDLGLALQTRGIIKPKKKQQADPIPVIPDAPKTVKLTDDVRNKLIEDLSYIFIVSGEDRSNSSATVKTLVANLKDGLPGVTTLNKGYLEDIAAYISAKEMDMDTWRSILMKFSSIMSEINNLYPNLVRPALIHTLNTMKRYEGNILPVLMLIGSYDSTLKDAIGMFAKKIKRNDSIRSFFYDIVTILEVQRLGLFQSIYENVYNLVLSEFPIRQWNFHYSYWYIKDGLSNLGSLSKENRKVVGNSYLMFFLDRDKRIENLLNPSASMYVDIQDQKNVVMFDKSKIFDSFFEMNGIFHFISVFPELSHLMNRLSPLMKMICTYDHFVAAFVDHSLLVRQGTYNHSLEIEFHPIIKAAVKKFIDDFYVNYVDYRQQSQTATGFDAYLLATNYLKQTYIRRDAPPGGYRSDLSIKNARNVSLVSRAFDILVTHKAFKTYDKMQETGLVNLTDEDLDALDVAPPLDGLSREYQVATNVLRILSADLMSFEGKHEDNVSRVMNYIISKVNALQGNEKTSVINSLGSLFYYYGPSGKYPDYIKKPVYIMTMMATADGDTVRKFVKMLKDNGGDYLIGANTYTKNNNAGKQKWLSLMPSIIIDCADDPELSDYLETVMEGVPANVVTTLRNNMLGANLIKNELMAGDIKPQIDMDTSRVKKILEFNDLNLSEILGPAKIRRKKGETFAAFIVRGIEEAKTKLPNLLAPLNVVANTEIDKNAINYKMITEDYAGTHGNLAPKILKVFDVNLSHEEFDAFKKANEGIGDAPIIPAYHGTGGVAAAMILRYGFKIITKKDESVTGRMLGHGIYFSNKIDKVSQYVSESGYARRAGYKGYIFDLDVNMGVYKRDYSEAGPGTRMPSIYGRTIISPEWAIFNPRAQARIMRVYEVEMRPRDEVFNELKKGKMVESFSDIKIPKEATSFIFRDGLIPIWNPEEQRLYYVDFEDALKKKLLKRTNFDVSALGPVVVFLDTGTTVGYDYRFADRMVDDPMRLYIKYFKRDMLGVTHD